jgi:hypothetical protein
MARKQQRESNSASKRYRIENFSQVREYKKAWNREKYRTDPAFRLRSLLRARLNRQLKFRKLGIASKAGSPVRDMGCSVESLISYLEAKFAPGMSWDNHGASWELDHIKPLVDFDLTERQQFLEACHYTNLQPLWIEEHLAKTALEANDRCKGSIGHSQRSTSPQKVDHTS